MNSAPTGAGAFAPTPQVRRALCFSNSLPKTFMFANVAQRRFRGAALLEVILIFLGENAVVLGGGAAALAIVETVFSPFRTIARRWKKPEKVELSNPEALQALADPQTSAPKLDAASFLVIQNALKADLESQLQAAHAEEKDRLRAQIAELEARIADPEPALKTANERITDLEARLTREGNDLGTDKLGAARAALETGDYTAADDLFAEIEARAAIAVQSAARAAFARGQIAEAEVRWADAATHYARAAGHEPTLDNLFKAREFAHRSGDYAAALGFGKAALKLTRDGEDQHALGKALNDHAALLRATGRYDEAEPLYREAMQITGAALGKDHPDYAANLNNLAGLLRATGRTDAAEPLMREAMQITGAALGKDHPDYAANLNNLAGLLRATGRTDAAEPLMREAMQITGAALGKDHPDYAANLNNLAALLEATGRYDEAEPLYREAMQITGTALGKDHPTYAASLNNLAALLEATGRTDAAEPLMREAMQITGAALGKDHPTYAARLNNLAGLLEATGRTDEAEPLMREAMQITGAALGKDHPGLCHPPQQPGSLVCTPRAVGRRVADGRKGLGNFAGGTGRSAPGCRKRAPVTGSNAGGSRKMRLPENSPGDRICANTGLIPTASISDSVGIPKSVLI